MTKIKYFIWFLYEVIIKTNIENLFTRIKWRIFRRKEYLLILEEAALERKLDLEKYNKGIDIYRSKK